MCLIIYNGLKVDYCLFIVIYYNKSKIGIQEEIENVFIAFCHDERKE